MINLELLANTATTAKGLSDLILVRPNQPIGYKPQATELEKANAEEFQFVDFQGQQRVLVNPEAFFFNYEGEQSIQLTSEITDHYVEDNTTIQDQVALAPEEITTNGFVSELNDIAPPPLEPLNIAAEKLVLVSAYTPQLSVTANLAYSRAKFFYDNALTIRNNAVQTWQSITGSTPAGTEQNKQQKAFQKFYGYWRERRLFTLQTPWAIFNNMIIKSLKAIQSADNNVISNFEITFKKMRFAQTQVAAASEMLGFYQSSRTKTQGADKVFTSISTPKNDTPLNLEQYA